MKERSEDIRSLLSKMLRLYPEARAVEVLYTSREFQPWVERTTYETFQLIEIEVASAIDESILFNIL